MSKYMSKCLFRAFLQNPETRPWLVSLPPQKFAEAVVCESEATLTPLTVILLYDCRVVPCHVLPPSVLTSSFATGWLALTTCIENQYADVPDLLCRTMGEVMSQATGV
jgi:hypothetical protein